MAYVLDQRLKAQQVEAPKKGMVLRDILQALFSRDFLQALFKEQPVGAFAETQSLFWKIAHSSIMRLNPSSMEKLYVLMVMGFKHQAMRCVAPEELCDLVLNHLEAIKELVDDKVTKFQIYVDDPIWIARGTPGGARRADARRAADVWDGCAVLLGVCRVRARKPAPWGRSYLWVWMRVWIPRAALRAR